MDTHSQMERLVDALMDAAHGTTLGDVAVSAALGTGEFQLEFVADTPDSIAAGFRLVELLESWEAP